MKEAKRIALRTGPKVWIEGEERQHLLDIRQNKIKPEAVIEELTAIKNEIATIHSNLPAETDIHILSKWLVETRMRDQIPSVERKPLSPLPNTNLELRDQAEKLMARYNVEGKLLCVVPSGSYLYGTNGTSFNYE